MKLRLRSVAGAYWRRSFIIRMRSQSLRPQNSRLRMSRRYRRMSALWCCWRPRTPSRPVILRDHSVAWYCDQVCRSNASVLSDRRSRRASIAGGAESVARQRESLVKNSILALRYCPRIQSLSRLRSLRSDRNFVRLIRVAKRRSEGAAAQKSLCVRQRRAIQIGRATRGVRHNVPRPLQIETRTGSVD